MRLMNFSSFHPDEMGASKEAETQIRKLIDSNPLWFKVLY